MPNAKNPELRLDVTPASHEQKRVLENLLELYTHDFSEFMDREIGPDGRFGYRDLEQYWTDPERFPFLVFVNGSLAGFVLMRGIPGGADEGVMWDVAEFLVIRGFRRRGIGTRVALEVFERFPGRWQVRVMRTNLPACSFWSRTVRAFAGHAVRLHHDNAHGVEWNVFSFNSPPAN